MTETNQHPNPEDDSGPDSADLDPARSDRPGGPGQAGGNIVAPGQVSPAADVGEVPEQDETVKARKAHLKDSQAGDKS